MKGSAPDDNTFMKNGIEVEIPEDDEKSRQKMIIDAEFMDSRSNMESTSWSAQRIGSYEPLPVGPFRQ